MEAPWPDQDFWRHPDEVAQDPARAAAEAEREAGLAALAREERRLLATLLGESAVHAELAERTAEAADDRNLRFLPPEKRQAMAEATAQWQLARENAFLAGDTAETQRLLEAADRALEEAVGRVLGPQEREEYQMRSSPLADGLREQLRGFQASREEFERIFRLERDFGEEHARLERSLVASQDPQLSEKLEAARIEHETRIREALGEKRFADYERSHDPDYQTLFGLTKDHAMPTELANQVWGMRREVETQTARIRDNPFLTAEQKTRALEAVRNETQSAIVDVLGEPLLRDYQREGGGWLVDLTDPTDLGETGRTVVPPPLPGISPEEGVADVRVLPAR
ncbi:MAG: hypothetical protein JNL97_04550 [Verrucomicrobiales bacterium]|nr:hypothetical protein [Verrucomicrobiales bacterium]